MFTLSLSNPLTINLLPKAETAWYYMKSSLFVTLFKTTGRGQGYLIPYSSQVHYRMQIVGMKNGERCVEDGGYLYLFTRFNLLLRSGEKLNSNSTNKFFKCLLHHKHNARLARAVTLSEQVGDKSH